MRSLACVIAVIGVVHVADATPCSVKIARAPEGVREVVVRWVLAERDCGPPLEVRIVETPDGLYVLARDEAGHVHERVVPDAQTAGVLIASWAASTSTSSTSAAAGDMAVDLSWTPGTTTPPDDMAVDLSWTPPRAPVTRPTPAPSPAGEMAVTLNWTPPSTPVVAAPVAAPGTMPVIADAMPVDGGVASGARKPAKWMSLGGMIGIGGAGAQGVRGEFDLAARGAWRIGVAGSIAHVDVNPDLGRYFGYLDLIDMQAAVYGAHSVDVGDWQLRAGAGVGFVVTKGNGTLFDRADANAKAALWPQISDLSAIGEVSLSISHGLGWHWPGWGFELGPVVTVHDQSMQLKMGESNLPWESTYERTTLELMFFGGIRHQL